MLVRRGPDRDARDSGQWGASFKYMFDPLDTEFGAAMNYHSRAAIFSATGSAIDLQPCLYVAQGPIARLAPLLVARWLAVFRPVSRRIFVCTAWRCRRAPTGTAWQGEVGYRPNAPVQLDSTDILFAGVTPFAGLSKRIALAGGTPGTDPARLPPQEVTQFQTTLTHFFDQVMGASRLTLVGEVGVTHVGGLTLGRALWPRPCLRSGRTARRRAGLNASTIAGAGPGAATNSATRSADEEFHLDLMGLPWPCDLGHNDVFAGVNLHRTWPGPTTSAAARRVLAATSRKVTKAVSPGSGCRVSEHLHREPGHHQLLRQQVHHRG